MISKELLNLNQTRSFGEKLGDSFAFVRLNAAVLLQTHLLVSLPIIIVIAAVFFLLFNGYFSLLDIVDSGPFFDEVADRFNSNSWFVQTILFPAFAVIPISANTLLVMNVYEQSGKDTLTFNDIRPELKKLPRLLLTKLIMLPIMFFPFLLLIPTMEEGARIVLVILLIGPIALIFYTLLTCAELLVLQHQYPPFKAIGRSFSVMGKHFWPSYGVHIVIVGLYLITTALLETPAWVADNLEGVAVLDWDMDDFWAGFGKALHAFSALAGYLLYMLPPITAGIVYFSIKEQVQRKNIMERINLIGVEEQPENIYTEDEQY